MSTEVAIKKRGRPKKVILDPIETAAPEMKISSSRAKSTKATSKSIKPKATMTPKSNPAQKPTAKPIEAVSSSAKPIPKVSTPAAATKSEPSSKAQTHTTKPTPVTPATSKILEQVRELSAKNTASTATKPSPTTATQSTSTPNNTTPKPAPSQTPQPSKPAQDAYIPTKPPPNPDAKPKIPFAAMNEEIVSKVSAFAGARPGGKTGNGQLPPGYKAAARRVTSLMVSLPILAVTSWMLYRRYVLGEEQKVWVPKTAEIAEYGPEIVVKKAE